MYKIKLNGQERPILFPFQLLILKIDLFLSLIHSKNNKSAMTITNIQDIPLPVSSCMVNHLACVVVNILSYYLFAKSKAILDCNFSSKFVFPKVKALSCPARSIICLDAEWFSNFCHRPLQHEVFQPIKYWYNSWLLFIWISSVQLPFFEYLLHSCPVH